MQTVELYLQLLMQSTWLVKTAVRSSLVPHAVLLMSFREGTGPDIHPCGFTASELSRTDLVFGVSGYRTSVTNTYKQEEMNFILCVKTVSFLESSHMYS